MSKPTLDIIVTHYNEPWEIGKPFFDMLEHQHCVQNTDYTVTLVQDGEENALQWNELLADYSYHVDIVTIDHAGVSAARNAGMDHTSADWIMFCDFDDMFADICALRMILDQFPVIDYDMIWGKYVTEGKWRGEGAFFNCIKEADMSSLTCKMYRRAFLEEKDIRFNTRVQIFSDYIFNAIVLAETQPYRIAALTTDFYVYLKRNRHDSFRLNAQSLDEIINSRFDRDIILAAQFLKRNLPYMYRKAIMSVACDEYFRLYDPEKEPNPEPVTQRFINFYREYRDDLAKLTQAETDVVLDVSENETMALVQTFYNEHLLEYYIVNDSVPFQDWLDNVKRIVETEETPHAEPAQNKPSEPGNAPRVAVFCGTYNTYTNMMTSAKSLLWHTPMDKIYFLIEDEQFPYDLPDIIECINVKNQQYFPETGPNYNNSWSYMCMMRAVFSKLIPHSKILSLDIDVIIQEDISRLWDIDLSDYYLAGVSEPQRQKTSRDPLYINFGVVMMNLDKIRSDGIDDQVISALNTTKFGCPEQDAFNKFCAFHIYQLPNDYNATVHSHITGEPEHERILHYAGIKFWRHYGQVKEYANRQWDTIMERQNILKRKEID